MTTVLFEVIFPPFQEFVAIQYTISLGQQPEINKQINKMSSTYFYFHIQLWPHKFDMIQTRSLNTELF